MAMILDAFVEIFAEKLTSMVSERVVMTLGVKDELKILQRRMARLQKFLEAAERKQLEDSAVNDWVSELKDVAYDADDIIDRCRIEGARLPIDQSIPSNKTSVFHYFSLLSSCCTSPPHRYQLAKSIKSLNDRLGEIYKDRVQFSFEESREKLKAEAITVVNTRQTSSLVEFDVVGSEIEEATKKLVTLIVKEQMNKCPVFAVTGMGGIGKTTLAQKIYNNKKIQTGFQIRVWVCVSQSFKEIELLQQVIREAGGHYSEKKTKTELLPLLQSTIHGKSLFLVLDDVWGPEVWIDLFRNPLLNAAAILRILVTTRDENVARRMGVVHIHPVTQLSIQTSWEMLRRKAFVEGQEEIGKLEDLGIQIVEKCARLPLAIKTIAGVLARKGTNRREWEKVLKNDAWTMNNLPPELRGALYLSYDDLPSYLQQCFVYCSLFPEDVSIIRDDIVRLWVAEGFVKERSDLLIEEVAEEYYDELIRRNLLQPSFDDARICTLHSLLRSLANFLSKDEIFSGNTMAVATTTSSRTKLRRLSIENQESVTRIEGLILEQKCLRTLLSFKGIEVLSDNQLARLGCLRVLLINNVDIDNIPNAIGDLIHLRYLDLDGTSIKVLPESIGNLTNLQFLSLRKCPFLTTLPKSITKLYNLRRLGIRNTPLISVPKGISELEKVNELSGFVVADPREPTEPCSSLEEVLNSLYQLRLLIISKMERAHKGALTLQKLTRLFRLVLQYTRATDRPLPTREEITRIEDVLEDLCPPQCLEDLRIKKFFGKHYPSWMKSPSFGQRLPHLTTLWLSRNISCPQLPPAGELPQLTHLYIKGAISVKSIGPEFLGIGVRESALSLTRTAFPNLQSFGLVHMPALEKWTFSEEMEGFEQGRGEMQVLTRLDELVIRHCPKLKALPKGLEQSKMKTLYIEGAYSLTVVDNLPNSLEKLTIISNQSLERVSHLPALQVLVVKYCPALSIVEKPHSLRRLELEDILMEELPEWLARLVEERQPADDDDDFLFQLVCNERVIRRLLQGGADWQIIQQIPRVFASDNVGKGFLRYTRNPFNYDTNLALD